MTSHLTIKEKQQKIQILDLRSISPEVKGISKVHYVDEIEINFFEKEIVITKPLPPRAFQKVVKIKTNSNFYFHASL